MKLKTTQISTVNKEKKPRTVKYVKNLLKNQSDNEEDDEFDDEEEFIKANEFLINEAVNDDDENLDEDLLEQKDEVLIEKLKSIDGRKSKRLRTEVVNNELDVNINSLKNDNSSSIHMIKTHELLHSLKNVSETGVLKKLFSKAHKRTKVLETPLPKNITEKSQRIATYIEDKKEISKWDPVVKRNRRSEQLIFPLKQPDYSMQTASTFTKTWAPETDLERQVAELLESSENNLKNQKLLTTAELKAVETMNLDQMKEKRAEFLKLKALQSYQEAKFKRLKHIKSKRYRKILRKEREKKEEKNLERLEKEDPIQFKEVLEEIEKKRMKERMSLKHKNTSKWAKAQSKYAKYSDRARDQIQEQLELSKQLTKKVKHAESEEEDEIAEKNQNEIGHKNMTDLTLSQNGLLINNPWMKMMRGVGKTEQDEKAANENENNDSTDFAKPKAFTDKIELENAQKQFDNNEEDTDTNDLSDDQDMVKEKYDNKKITSIFQDNDSEQENKKLKKKIKKHPSTTKKNESNQMDEINFDEKGVNLEKKNIEPINFENKTSINIEVKTSTKNSINPLKDEKDKQQHQLTLSEAFADDDVIEEFKMEKKKIEDNEKVKPIDLTMPGWGGWAGAGIDLNALKKKQQIKFRNKRNGKYYRKPMFIKPQDVLKTEEDKKQMERRDKDLTHVIISEKKDNKIAAFQINELPHQYKSVADFENKIAQPIGRTWNPDSKFRKLTMPKVRTKIGTIIDPIDKEDMIKKVIKK